MKKQNIFNKVMELSGLKLDNYINNLKKSNRSTIDLPFGMQWRKSYDHDPDKRQSQYGYREKYTLVPDSTKLLMYLRDPVISAIVKNRTDQVSEFSRPQKDKYDTGFTFTLKNKSKKEETSEQNEQEINFLNNFIYNCGVKDKHRDKVDENMNFETFLKLIVKDRLILDQVNIEKIPDVKGDLHHFLPVSSATIRFAAQNLSTQVIDNQNYNDRFIKEEYVEGNYKYVQIINGQIRKAFYEDEMVMAFGNPVSDMFTNGYSIGELDLLMNIITAHLNAEKRNRSVFENGFTAPGIINLKGDVHEDQLEAFRRAYYAQGTGVNSMYRTPVINSPDGLEFVKLNMTSQDMEYSHLMDYLIKIMCALYATAPEEINFSSSSKADGSATGNYNNIESRLKISKHKGLRPLLRFIENIINQEILPNIGYEWINKYEFKFVGLDTEDKKAELERLEKEVKTYKTVNEVRKEMGLDPIEGCDILLENNFLQWYMQMSIEGKKLQQEIEEEEKKFENIDNISENNNQIDEEDNNDLFENENNTDNEQDSLPFEKSNNPKLIKIEVYKKDK